MNSGLRVHPANAGMETTIFEKMSGLARQLAAINLGQGFREEQGPPELILAAAPALSDKSNQYPPGSRLPELQCADQCRTLLLHQGGRRAG